MAGLTESAVVGVSDERMGEVGRAYVMRRPGAELAAEDAIAILRGRLANFKVPREVVFIDKLPRNPSGKVLKTGLRSEQ